MIFGSPCIYGVGGVLYGAILSACPIADLRQPPPHCKHVMELRSDGCYMFKLECTSPSPHSSTIQLTTTPADSYQIERRCRQGADSGSCVANVTRWYFNRRYAQCKQFRYGGCQGNSNNFLTREDCEEYCGRVEDCPIFKVAAPPVGCHYEHLTRLNGCTRPIIMCPDAGCGTLPCEKCQICDNTYTEQCKKKWTSACRPVGFTCSRDQFCEDEACRNFRCSEGFKCEFEAGKGPHCIPDVPKLSAIRRCRLSPESGPCKAQIPMFYYDKLYGKCLNFTYGGCGGNLNRFDTEQACMEACGEIGGRCPVPGLIAPPQGCEYKAEVSLNGCDSYTLMCPGLGCATKPCKQCQICANKFQKSYDWSKEECKPIGYQCKKDPVCEKWQCDNKSCPAGFQCQFTPDQGAQCIVVSVDLSTQHQCRLQKDAGPCKARKIKWYYNPRIQVCQTFTYGGCHGNNNRFDTRKQCMQTCGRVPPCMIPLLERLPAGCHYNESIGQDGCPQFNRICSQSQIGGLWFL